MPLTTLRVIFTWFAPGLYGMSSLAWCIKSPYWEFLLWAPPNQEFSSINRSSGTAWSVHANKETHEAFLTSRIFLHSFYFAAMYPLGFPCDSVVKNSPANSGDAGLIPGSGIFPEEGNGNPLQYSCLGNSMDRGAMWLQKSQLND